MSKPNYPMIERLRVRNYLGLFDINTTFEPLTVLVGPNGAGKSMLLDVLRFLRDSFMSGLEQTLAARGGLSTIRRWLPGGLPYDVTIQIRLRQGPTEDYPYHRKGEYSFTLSGDNRPTYKITRELLVFQEANYQPVIFEVREGAWEQCPRNPREIMGQSPSPTVLNFPKFSGLLHLLMTRPQSGHRIPWSDWFFEFFRGISFYNISPDVIRGSQKMIDAYPLDERGQNLASTLRAQKLRKTGNFADRLRLALAQLVPGVTDFSVRHVGEELVTTLRHALPQADRRGPAFSMAQESDGILRALGVLTALYQEPPRALMTIENPDLMFHPPALGLLADSIREASEQGQVFVTTHNPDLVDLFPIDELRVFTKELDGPRVGPLSQRQRQLVAAGGRSVGALMRDEGLRPEIVEPAYEDEFIAY